MTRNDYTCIGLSYTVPVLETQQGVHGEAKNHKHTVILYYLATSTKHDTFISSNLQIYFSTDH